MFYLLLLKNNIIYYFILFYFLFKNILYFNLFMNHNFIFIMLMLIMIYFFLKMIMYNNMVNLLIIINLIFNMLFFMSKTMMMLYIFYEMSIFPILLIILLWGYQIERLQASSFFWGYALMFGVPSFIIIIKMQMEIYLYFKMNFIFSFILLMMFLVKLPVFMFHIWLPKMHVESPTVGSILLASILLKLGGWGILIIIMLLNNNFIYIIIMVSVVGASMTSIICMIQSDLKMIIAYSSVIHMNLMLSLILIKFNFIKINILIIMFYHAAVSSMMFFLAGINYYNLKTRLMYFMSQSSKNVNMFYLFPPLIFLMNFNIPPFIGVYPEIITFTFMFYYNFIYTIILIILLLIGSLFCIYILLLFMTGKKSMFIKFSYPQIYKMMNYFLIMMMNYFFIYLY